MSTFLWVCWIRCVPYTQIRLYLWGKRSHEKSPVIFSLLSNSLWIYKLSHRKTSGLPEVCSFLFTSFTCVALEILAPNRQNSSLARLTLERPKFGSPWSQELLYVCFFLPESSLFLLQNIPKIGNSILTRLPWCRKFWVSFRVFLGMWKSRGPRVQSSYFWFNSLFQQPSKINNKCDWFWIYDRECVITSYI